MAKQVFPVVVTAEQIMEHNDGVCYGCGAITSGGCEPDMRTGKCDDCGESLVHGLEEALLDGKVTIADDVDGVDL